MPTPLPQMPDTNAIAKRARPPLWSGAAGNPMDLHGILNGCSVFLIAGGPSFKNIDLSALQQPGCLTMGLNNSAKTFRPDLWISVDKPSHFLRSIWLDPKILKFVRSNNRDSPLIDCEAQIPTDTTPLHCPNIVFFESDLKFRAANFLTDESVSWGDKDTDGGRSVMLAALKILYHLGVGNVFLLGVDFRMSADYAYHFPQQRGKSSVEGNLKSYKRLGGHFELLRPMFEEEGFYVWNCNPDSNLKAFPFCSFEDAVKFATLGMPSSIAKESSEGLYDRVEGRNNSAGVLVSKEAENDQPTIRRVDRKKRPKTVAALDLECSVSTSEEDTGVLLFGDDHLEWMIPWWFHHFDRSNSDLRVAVADFGLSRRALGWLERRGVQIVPRRMDLPCLASTWFYKPFAVSNSPFDYTVFSDLDCEIRGNLSPIFSWSQHGLVLGNDLFPLGNSRKLFRERFYYNSGLIGVKRDNPILDRWCDETEKIHDVFRSDQEILNLVIYESEAKIVELPKHFHQLRLDGDHENAVVMHWTGPPGKAYIRKNIEELSIDSIS